MASAREGPRDAASSTAAAERLLAAHGYAVTRRAGDWHECVLARDGEVFAGRGRDADEAFAAALAKLLPGALPRALFDAALAALDVRDAQTADVRSSADDAPVASAPAAPPAPVQGAVPPPEAALAALDELLAQAAAAEPEILLDAPDPLRWQMAALLGRARAEQERTAHPAVVWRVKQLAGRLSQWSHTAWPGDFPLLRLDATPADGARWLGGAPAASWDQVAELAERKLAAFDLSDGGWIDGAACEPPPASATWSLAHARHSLEKRLGAGATPDDAATRQAADRWRDHEKTIESFVRAARELRWVRPIAPDARAWGQAIGLLRWVAHHWRLPAGHPLVVALDPTTVPRPDWSHELGRDPRTLERKRRQRAIVRGRPSRATDPAAVLAWFRDAAEVFHAPELAPLCADVAARLLALDSTAAFPAGPARERLKGVQKRLAGAPPSTETLRELAPALDDDEADAEAPEHAEPTPIERARTQVRGKRALVVGNREDPHLSRRYHDDLGLATTWCDASQGARSVDAAVERIPQGAFDLVLCHTGFVSHATDGKVKRACREAGVRYVPVYKGRLLRTALALLEQDQAAA